MSELGQQGLSLEQQIQGLVVSLGDLYAENELVTVKLRHPESRVTKGKIISAVSHACDALAWTVSYIRCSGLA